MPYTTTLAALRESNACKRGYDLIANHVGADFPREINLLTILEVNGVQDCIWTLRTVGGGAVLAAEFAIRTAYPFGSKGWKVWADAWLSGEDRSLKSANKAADNAFYTARTTDSAADAAFYAAHTADALYTAFYAAHTAHTATDAADASRYAAEAAFYAAKAARYATTTYNDSTQHAAEHARQVEILTKLLS
jgi:hypothetical protein